MKYLSPKRHNVRLIYVFFLFSLFTTNSLLSQNKLSERQLKNINRFVDGFNQQDYRKLDKSLCFLARVISSEKMLKGYLGPQYASKGKLKPNGPIRATKDRIAVYPYISEKDTFEAGYFLEFYFSKRGKIMSFSFSYDDINYPEVTDTTTVDEVANAYRSFVNHASTALVVGCYNNGEKTIYSYGETPPQSGALPDGNTIYEIGSITKVFTGILLAQHINAGRMDTTDVLSKYLPDSIPPLAYEGREINIKDLITHTSALPREPNNYKKTMKSERDPFGNYQEKDLMEYLKNEKLKREPGKKYRYSNTGVGLIAYLMARNDKSSYDNLVVSNITSKLGMNDTRVTLNSEQEARKVTGYYQGQEVEDMTFTEVFVGAGAIHSTVNDMFSFMEANMNPENTPLQNDLLLAQQPRKINKHLTMGLAWDFSPVPGEKGRMVMGHSGNTVGTSCILLIDKEKKLGIIVFANSNVPVDGIGRRVYQLMLKQ